jgi:D-3-phosphoglycerate dehydrogenase
MKLLITEPKDFSKKALNSLLSHFEVTELNSISALDRYIHEIDILFIRLGIFLDKSILQKAKQLKYICTPTTGLDHIDIEYCRLNNIQVISLKGERTFLDSIPSTAEHSWTLLMALNRKIFHAVDHVQQKQWNRDLFKSYNLKNRTLGILGLGRVGLQVAKYGHTFGMKTIGFDTNPNIGTTLVDKRSSAEDLFTESDFISIHIPLNSRNIKFVNSNLIDLMKPNACIINTSRGKVWDEAAITDALINNKLRGIASDVLFEELSEQPENSPLLNIDCTKYNCIITPHIAGATYDSMLLTEEFIAEKIISYV